jgi:hypothetical protein
MVSKALLVKLFAAAVIGFFVLELFVVLLYSGNTPPPSSGASATPLASVAPGELTPGLPGFNGQNASAVFIGSGRTRASVTGFQPDNILECPSGTVNANVETAIAKVEGVSNTRNYGNGLIGFQASANQSAAAFALLAVKVQAAADNTGACPSAKSTVHRLALVQLPDASVTLTASVGGKTQTLSQRAILAFFSQIGRTPFALSPPEVGAGENATVEVLAQNHGGVFLPDQGDYINLLLVPVETAPASTASATAANTTA